MKNFSLFKINPNALEICQKLYNSGYQAFIVGGCIRDLLLNLTPKDWDITTNALPDEIIRIFNKTIPTGLQHGTITVILNNELFEVTTFRTESTYSDGRRPDHVTFVSSIEEDLSRRDLTINAMAFDPINQKIIDPFQGSQDLENKIIRAVGAPLERFNEDALRILRVARFASRFNFKIDLNTLQGMEASREQIRHISKERIKEELSKILISNHPEIGLNILIQSKIIPFISSILESHQISGALRHMLPLIQHCKGEWITKLALLFFPSLDQELENELKKLTFSNLEIKKVLYLNSNIDKYFNTYKDLPFTDIKCFIASLKNTAIDENSYDEFCKYCLALECDFTNDHIALINIYIPLRKELKINGDDLIALGFEKGKNIGHTLDLAYQQIIENPELNERMWLINFCLKLKANNI